MYFDRNEKTGQRVNVKSATNFIPLFAGAATPERARRMVREHLLNPAEFWLTYPVASYAETEPDYYQGALPRVQLARAHLGAHQLHDLPGPAAYGYHAEARELARRLFNMAVLKNPVLREYYNAETGDGLGQTRFWGFTALYYGMLLESTRTTTPQAWTSRCGPSSRRNSASSSRHCRRCGRFLRPPKPPEPGLPGEAPLIAGNSTDASLSVAESFWRVCPSPTCIPSTVAAGACAEWFCGEIVVCVLARSLCGAIRFGWSIPLFRASASGGSAGTGLWACSCKPGASRRSKLRRSICAASCRGPCNWFCSGDGSTGRPVRDGTQQRRSSGAQ